MPSVRNILSFSSQFSSSGTSWIIKGSPFLNKELLLGYLFFMNLCSIVNSASTPTISSLFYSPATYFSGYLT